MQNLIIYGDLANRRITDETGAPLTLPPFVQGDFVSFALRLTDPDETSSATTIVKRNVRSLRASLGNVAAPPLSGQFSLRIGPNGTHTALIDFNSDHASLKPLLAALPETATYGGVEHVFESTAGCWMIQFRNNVSVPLQAADNLLSPVSFIRVRPFEQNGRWWHEVRLLQAPLAFSPLTERRLPDAPSVRRIRAGCTTSDGLNMLIIDEIQAVKVPPAFDGTYYLKFNGMATPMLSPQDDIAAIEKALNDLFTDGQQRFRVTNPEQYNAYVDFMGPLAGMPQDLLEALVGSAGNADLIFNLDLNTVEVEAALRNTDSINPQFEVELEIAEDNDPPEVPGKIITLFRNTVTLVRELQYAELAEVANIDWLRPPQPVDYIPFTRDQIITGSQHYVGVLGDGVNSEFSIPHNLGTDALHVTLRENADGGKRLDNYEVDFTDPNSLLIKLADVPAADSLAVTITSAGPKSAFQAHTHTIEQILGLQDVIDSLNRRVTALETLIPNAPIVNQEARASGTFNIPFTDFSELLFAPASVAIGSDGAIDRTKLPRRAPFMLPMVSNAGPVALPSPLPNPVVGSVWSNGGAAIQIPGGGMIRASSVLSGGFVASDGRILYPARQSGQSYYPIPFERELWRIYINEKILAIGRTLTAGFALELQLLNATSNAEWVLVIEKGAATEETVPPNDLNLENIVWDTDNPILKQRLLLVPTRIAHVFGCAIARTVSGMTANRLLYGYTENANSGAPVTANFALRARLIEFDTENSDPTARGWVNYHLTDPSKLASLKINLPFGATIQ